jgi:hypothetical protein
LIDCFSRLAKALDSLHGVRPAMSAAAGGGEVAAEERRTEESASAAEKVLMEVDREGALSLEAEQETVRRAGERARRGLAAKAVEVAMEAVRPAIAAAAASVARGAGRVDGGV